MERSSAKKVSDESVMISTADLDTLGNLIEQRHVDGVLVGISEFNLLKAMSLAEKFKMPFYCFPKQGVTLFRDIGKAKQAIDDAFYFSRKNKIIAEEYIEKT